jgi:hypothetical protein
LIALRTNVVSANPQSPNGPESAMSAPGAAGEVAVADGWYVATHKRPVGRAL